MAKEELQTWKGDIYKRKQRAIIAAKEALKEAKQLDRDCNVHKLMSEIMSRYAIPRKGLKEEIESYLTEKGAHLDPEGNIIWLTKEELDAITRFKPVEIDPPEPNPDLFEHATRPK